MWDAQGADTGGATDLDAGGRDTGRDLGDPHQRDCLEQVFEEVDVPMRDGASLSALVRRPAAPGCRVPAIVIQTPYGKENARALWLDGDGDHPLFDDRHYGFVLVDWRGFFGSRDAAVQGRQPYGEDGYDVVEWVAAQPWCTGAVGTWGVSALCVQQYRTAAQHPPHLAAAVPIFCQMNSTYEQYYPGGVLRREYFEFLDGYYGTGEVILDHPYRDRLWEAAASLIAPEDIQVPMLLVSGWWDLYDTGTLSDFRALVQRSGAGVRGQHRLLVGPWIHYATGGESAGGRDLDELELQYVDTERVIQIRSLAFFDHHLRGLTSATEGWPVAQWIVGGSRELEGSATWPPEGTEPSRLYPTADLGLATTSPGDATLELRYDPTDPSPTLGGCTLLPRLAHGPRPQDEVISRGDALVFVTPPLEAPMSLRGAITLELDVATSGRDTDFAIRVTDVDQEGRHLLIAEGIARLKLRDGFEAPVEVRPGTRYHVTVRTTNELAYDIPPEHRLGLVLTSSNYPRFDRNPNTGADFYEDASEPISVVNRIFLGPGTRLLLPTPGTR